LVLTLVAGGASAATGTAATGFALTGQLRRLGIIRLAAAAITFPLTSTLTIVSGPVGYLWGLIVGNLGLMVILVVLASRQVQGMFGPPAKSCPMPKGLMGFAVKSSAATSVALGTDVGILALAGLLGSPSLVTLIKIASAPGRLLLTLASPVAAQMYPRFATAAATGNLFETRRETIRVTAGLAGVGLIAITAGYVGMGTALRLVYGTAYGFLAPTAVLFIVAAGLRATVVWSKVLPLALGRPGVRLALTAAESVALALALVVAIRQANRSVDTVLGFAWGSVAVAVVVAATWLVLLRVLPAARRPS
jgi:O-antigen/teichoic acid export membrane protein